MAWYRDTFEAPKVEAEDGEDEEEEEHQVGHVHECREGCRECLEQHLPGVEITCYKHFETTGYEPLTQQVTRP